MDLFFDIMDALAGILNLAALFAAIIGVYLAPSFIAYHRDHHNFTAIFAVNILLGWTLLFWAVAVIWSLTAVRTQQ